MILVTGPSYRLCFVAFRSGLDLKGSWFFCETFLKLLLLIAGRVVCNIIM